MSGFVRLADYFVVTGFDYENCRHFEGCGRMIQRLPEKEWDNVPYVFHIEDFCQPNGWYIQTSRQPPTFFVVPLSDISGNKFYCACLAFSEPVPSRYAQQFGFSPSRKSLAAPSSRGTLDHDFFVAFFVPPSRSGGGGGETPATAEQQPPGSPMVPSLFAPKCLSLIASHCHFDVLKNSLSVLYAVYVNEGHLYSLERIVASILSSVDVPLPGGPRTVFTLGAGDRQTLLPPRSHSVPVTKRSVYLLLRQFGIQNVILLVAAMLTDRKILLCSRTMTRLSEAAFALTALIYPIQFEHVFVPILPKRLMEMISAPPPYIFGIHIDCLSDIPDVCDVYIADLDGGSVTCPADGSLPSRLLEPFYQHTFSMLVQIFSPDLLTADHLFETRSNLCAPAGEGDVWVDKQLRGVFMMTLVGLLAGYRSCLTVTRISPKAVIHFDKSLFVLLRGFQDHEQFMKNFLSSQLFDSFIRRRGPPFRVCDIFDEIYGRYQPGDGLEEEDALANTAEDMDLVATVAQKLGENENLDVESVQELPPFVSMCGEHNAQSGTFPILDDNMVAKHMSEFSKKKRPLPPNLTSVECRFVPHGFNLRQRLNTSHLLHEKRLVIRQFLVDIFAHRMTEALRRKNTIIQDLQSRHIRRIFVDELRHAVMDCPSTNHASCQCEPSDFTTSVVASSQTEKLTQLSMEQFELIIALLSDTLSKNGASDESCIGATIMQLSHNLYMETEPSKWRYYAYMTPQIQEHAIWESHTFWETAFCSEVNRQLREVYLYHSESQHQPNNVETASARKIDHACPVYANRMSLLEIAAEELKVRPHRDPELQRQLEKQEENCISAIITHFITLIVQFRLPLKIAQGMANSDSVAVPAGKSLRNRTASKPSLPLIADGVDEAGGPRGELSEGHGSYSHLSEGQQDSDAEVGNEPPTAPLNTARQTINNLENWLTKFITKVAHENHLSDRQLADAITKPEFIIEGHLNELEMIFTEVSSMRWNRLPEVMRPILLPEEIGVRVLGRDRLHCFLLATGHYDSVVNVTEYLLCSYVNATQAQARSGGRRGFAGGLSGGGGGLWDNGAAWRIDNSSLLPAQGCLFLTNYRLIFNGLPMDPFQSNKPVTVTFPISSIVQVRKIGGGSRRLYSMPTGEEHVLELLSIRSACMQTMLLGLESLPPMDHCPTEGVVHSPEGDLAATATIRGVRSSALSRSDSISSGHSWGMRDTLAPNAGPGSVAAFQSGRQPLSALGVAFQMISPSTLREELRNLLMAMRYPQRVAISFLDLNDFVGSDSYLIFNYQNHDITGGSGGGGHALHNVSHHRQLSGEGRKSRTHTSASTSKTLISHGRTITATQKHTLVAGAASKSSSVSATNSAIKSFGAAKNVPLSALTATIQKALPKTLSKSSTKQENQPDMLAYQEILFQQLAYRDLVRQNLLSNKATDCSNSAVRVTDANCTYALCDTYPAFLLVPKGFPDESMEKLAKSFHNNRLPVVMWRNPSTSAFLLRSGHFQLKKYHHITSMFTSNKNHLTFGGSGSGLPISQPLPNLLEPVPDSRRSSVLWPTFSMTSLHRLQATLLESGGSGDSYLSREQEHYLRALVATTRSAMSMIEESDAGGNLATGEEPPLLASRLRDQSAFSSVRSSAMTSRFTVGRGSAVESARLASGGNQRGAGMLHMSHQISEVLSDNTSVDQVSTNYDDNTSLAAASHEAHSATLYVMGERSQMKTLHKSCRHRLPDVDFIPLQVPTKKRMKDAFQQLMNTWMPSENVPTMSQLVALQQRHQQEHFLVQQHRRTVSGLDDEDTAAACLMDDQEASMDVDLEALLKGGTAAKTDSFREQLKSSMWLSLVQLLLQQAGCVVDLMQCQGASVLLSLELDSDVGAQLSSLARILMDSHYRTLRGFCALVDHEWLTMGHDFMRRSVQTSQNKASNFTPAFLLFLDAVHQLICQFPLAFEFNTFFLSFLAYHHVSNRFYNFKLFSERARLDWMLEESGTAEYNSHSVWSFVEQQHEEWPVFFNFSYFPEDATTERVLRPSHHMASLQLWDFFLPDPLVCGSSVYDLDHHSPNFMEQERQQYDPAASNGYNHTHVAFVNAMLNLRQGEDAYGWQAIWNTAREHVTVSAGRPWDALTSPSHFTKSLSPSTEATSKSPASTSKPNSRRPVEDRVMLYELVDEMEGCRQELAHTWCQQSKLVEEHRQQSLCLVDERHARRLHRPWTNTQFGVPSGGGHHMQHVTTAHSQGEGGAVGGVGGGSSSSSSRAHFPNASDGNNHTSGSGVRPCGDEAVQMWTSAHQFIRAPTTLTTTKCQFCDRFLLNFGISRGIVRCALCEYLCHENCAAHVPPRCPMGQHSGKLLTTPPAAPQPAPQNSPQVVVEIGGAGGEENFVAENHVPNDAHQTKVPPSLHGTCLQNYFYKLSHHKLMQQWKERFFILDPGTYKICYKDHEKDAIVQGVIDLNDVTKIHPVRPGLVTHHKRSIDAFVLEIETSSRSFRLASGDESIVKLWYDSLTGLFR